jgi:DNA-binding transcriptional MocR family regulator
VRTVVRSADVLVLVGLLKPGLAPNWSVRSLAAELELSPAAVQRSLARLGETPVYDARVRRIDRTAAEELLTRATQYIAPARWGAPTRGMPTAWAAPPLAQRIGAYELPPVWPDPHGTTRGLAVEPLHEAAPRAARANSWLYESLALIDGIRLGDARVREEATQLLRARLGEVGA